MSNPTTVLSIDDISILDKQIDQLTEFKPIAEHEVKMLCDKVPFFADRAPFYRLKKSSFKNQMCSRFVVPSLSAVTFTVSYTT